MSEPSSTEVVTHQPEGKVVEYTPIGSAEPIKLSVQLVRRFIAQRTKSGAEASDVDCMKFVMLCKVRGLDPWQGDAYLQGFDGQDGPQFSLITAHQAFLKRAEVNPKFDGMVSGVVCQSADGKIVEYEGDFVLDGDKLVGGWARVLIKERKLPMYKRLKLSTFNTGKSRWGKDPAGMIVKCAEADALRSAFPTSIGGMYLAEETQPVIDIAPPEKPRFRAPKAVTQPSPEPERSPVAEPTRPKTETVIEPIVEQAPPTQPSPRTDGYPLPWSKLQTILDEEGASFDTLCEVCRQVSVWTPFTDGCVEITDIKKSDVEALLAKTKSLRTFLKDILGVAASPAGTTAGGAE